MDFLPEVSTTGDTLEAWWRDSCLAFFCITESVKNVDFGSKNLYTEMSTVKVYELYGGYQ